MTREGQNKIDSIVARINGSNFGQENYASLELKATAYLYFLIKDHPLTDGNKRTATITFEVFCDLNDLEPDYSQLPLDALAVFIEKVQEKDHHKVIEELSTVIFPKAK